MYAYCLKNDILIKAPSLKAAREYAEYRLSPAYGHPEGRSKNLNLVRINEQKAREVEYGAIFWEVT